MRAKLNRPWRRHIGMSLVEVMISLVIGLALTGAVALIYINGSHMFGVHRNMTDIQENGRFMMHIMQEDIRLAGFWGLNIRPDTIDQSEAIQVENECAPDWLINVTRPVEVANNTNSGYTACVPDEDYMSGTDILVVRHASSNSVADDDIVAGTIYLRTSLTSGTFFIADGEGMVDAGLEIKETPVSNYVLRTHVYYVRPWSRISGDDIPTLVREVVAGTAIRAEPLVEHVEDLQISLGLDTDGDGNVDRHATDGTSLAQTGDNVLTITVEALVRAPTSEAGYTNTRVYQLGDRDEFIPKDRVRRQVFREIIFLRNQTREAPI